jgi:hypothetical protein
VSSRVEELRRSIAMLAPGAPTLPVGRMRSDSLGGFEDLKRRLRELAEER